MTGLVVAKIADDVPGAVCDPLVRSVAVCKFERDRIQKLHGAVAGRAGRGDSAAARRSETRERIAPARRGGAIGTRADIPKRTTTVVVTAGHPLECSLLGIPR